VFDLLTKENLSPQDIEKIKQIATQLLKTLKQEKLKIDRWPDKESSRAEVKTTIHNFLYSDDTGLPVDLYTEEEVEEKNGRSLPPHPASLSESAFALLQVGCLDSGLSIFRFSEVADFISDNHHRP